MPGACPNYGQLAPIAALAFVAAPRWIAAASWVCCVAFYESGDSASI